APHLQPRTRTLFMRWVLVLITNVNKDFLVVAAGIFFLSFSKWYVVRDAADSSIGLGIFLGHLERDTNWHRRDAARPIKLDMPCPNILFGFPHGISRIPSRLRRNATPGSQRQYENAECLHTTITSAPIIEREVFFKREMSLNRDHYFSFGVFFFDISDC